MSRADRYLRACKREEPDCTPVWFMRQAGRYLPEYRAIRSKVGFLQLCKTPDLAAEVTIQPVERLGVDAAIPFRDTRGGAEAMGLALELEDKGPHFPEPLQSRADVDRLRVPDPRESLGFVPGTIRGAKKPPEGKRRLGGKGPLIGFCGGPWALAADMIEGKTSRSFEKAKAALLSDESLASALLTKISDALIAYLQAQLDAGADALQIFDSWAGALAPDDYSRIGSPYIARVIRSLRREGQPVTVFGVETGELLGVLAGTGADMVGVDWRIPLSDARKRTGDGVALQGNLDPAS